MPGKKFQAEKAQADIELQAFEDELRKIAYDEIYLPVLGATLVAVRNSNTTTLHISGISPRAISQIMHQFKEKRYWPISCKTNNHRAWTRFEVRGVKPNEEFLACFKDILDAAKTAIEKEQPHSRKTSGRGMAR